MNDKIRKFTLTAALCLLALCFASVSVPLAYAREQSYYVCFSNQNYSVRNANKMEFSDGEYVLRNVSLSSVVDFYVADNSGMRWYAADNAPMKVDEPSVLRYDILFSPDGTYPNGSHVSYRFYEPDSYVVSVNGEQTELAYNPYHTAYDLYIISSIGLDAGATVAVGEETHTVAESGYYRILFTPGKTVNGNKYLFDADGNYGSGDDYVYTLYIEDAPQYYAVFENVAAGGEDAQINGGSAVRLDRYENNTAAAEYRSTEVFAPERDFGIRYRVYELNADGSYRLIDDDNNSDTQISKITVGDVGKYTLSLTDVGESYISAFAAAEKKFGAWYLSGEFNGYCFDGEGNVDLSEDYKFAEIEEGDDDYDEDYVQYVVYFTVSSVDLRGGGVEFYITDGKTKFKDGADYIKITIAGTYKIVCSEEHTYGRNRHFRYVLKDESEDAVEITIGSAEEFAAFAKSCSKSADYSINLKAYLTCDIDFAGAEFVPVGAFSGVFYGGYHKLKNITYKDGANPACVFQTLTYTATVERLTVENIDLGDKNTELAGVVGTNYGKVNAVTVSGKISGKNNVGGVVAVNGRSDTDTGDSGDTVNRATVVGCKNTATVTGEKSVGGICGRNTGDISSCENHGAVVGRKTYPSSSVAELGGIAGYSYGKLYDCVNQGEVGGGDPGQYVGGIVGLCVGEIYYATNRGGVSADRYAGGLVGYYGSRQTESSSVGGIMGGDTGEQDPVGSKNILDYGINYGDVSANSYAGGILGNLSALGGNSVTVRRLKVYNCASVGNITASAGSYAGGIAGYAVGADLRSCLSSGTIQSKGMMGGSYVGGIVGYGGDVYYSMSAATVKGSDYLGGIAGYASSAVVGCYTNVMLLPSDGAVGIGGIAGGCADFDPSTNKFTAVSGNYYIGAHGGIGGTDYAAAFDFAAVSVPSETLASAGALSPELCEDFSREYWEGGKISATYPTLRNFETPEQCDEFGDDELFAAIFDKHAQALSELCQNAAEVTYTVTFMEWNKDNGDLYEDGEIKKDNFDIVSVVRAIGGQKVDAPAPVFAERGENDKYVYEGSEARYFVSMPGVQSVDGNTTVYAQYREIVTSLTVPENKVFAESEFVIGTEISLVKIGEYRTVKFTLDDEEITVENITLKYLVGDKAAKYEVLDSEGHTVDSFVSGKYICFAFTSGDYFTVRARSSANMPFWAWLLIGIGGTLAVCGAVLLAIFLVKRKNKNKAEKKENEDG